MKIRFGILIFGLVFLIGAKPDRINSGNPEAAKRWAFSMLDSMSLEEKIGQLIMIRAHSNLGPDHIESVKKSIVDYHIGGLCFFQGSPEKQAELTNEYQELSEIPLMVAIDAEWGLGMRFPEKAISFPRQLMLGAIQDNSYIYEMGTEVARQLRRIGVHVNFAPVVDVNNNPLNPVINDRSFGESRFNVAAKSYAYMKGMQDGGIMACAKHFPGHGDTDVDSHLDLPIIKHKMDRLDSIELMPFKVLSEHGVQSMMIAHLHVPSLDDRQNWPTSLSKNTIHQLLKEEIGFKGLVFTDALEMKGVRKHFEPGQVEAEALIAGNDVLVLPDDLPKAVQTIKEYVENGKISEAQIDESVIKILQEKFKLGLITKQDIQLENIQKDIHQGKAYQLKSKLIEQAITIANNEKELLPLKLENENKFYSISIGSSAKTPFQKQLDLFGLFEHKYVPKKLNDAQIDKLISGIAKETKVIISLHDMSKYARNNFGVDQSSLKLINALNERNHLILVVFGSPYSLKYFEDIPSILMSYNEDKMTQQLSAQAIFGGFPIRGKLPVSASPKFQYMKGYDHPGWKRLSHSIPEAVGLQKDSLVKIDSIIGEMIEKSAAPGCQILVAKDNRIVFQKSYGTHTPGSEKPVQNSDVYDIASITKIASTTLAVMKLHEEGKLDINLPIAYYLPELDTTDKSEILVKDIMAHHAGLKSWIPFYKSTLELEKISMPDQRYYRDVQSDSFSIKVASDLYLRTDYKDSIWHKIITTPVSPEKKYVYSDLGFYLLSEAVERITSLSIDQYVDQHFYQPLGLGKTCYNPSYVHPLENIVPSEHDKYFRHQKLQGYVHDMGAAMMGGVCGHAGLFSNAEELAILMQMLLNGGSYGGKQYLKPETVARFTRRYPGSSRRAIGFDSKELNEKKYLNMAEQASDATFGHMGFTGACAWADPEHNLVYIFLSNRTFPSMDNRKFIRNNYRPRVQAAIYNSMAGG